MWRVSALSILVAGSVACGGSGGSDDNAGDQPAAATALPATSGVVAESGDAAVPDALRFASPLVGGGSIEGASLAGRPTVLWFWAPT